MGRRRKRSSAKRATKTTKDGNKPLAWYKKELDTWFSMYIRIRDNGTCITCGSKTFWKYQQNGHYVSRQVLSLRFDEKNCNCQCAGCNVFKHGNMDEYALQLQRKYGKDILERLHKEKYKIVKLDIPWYEQKIKYYKTWVNEHSTI